MRSRGPVAGQAQRPEGGGHPFHRWATPRATGREQDEPEVMPSVEGTDFKTRLAGGLLVLGTGPVERVLVRSADGEEAGELQLGVPATSSVSRSRTAASVPRR